jgi:hypothetical protein
MHYFGLGQTSSGRDPRITSTTPMSDIRNFCQGDIGNGNPNSYACGVVAANSNQNDNQALCQQGVAQACRIAGIEAPSAAEQAEMARRREEMAQQDRDRIADILTSKGINPLIVSRIRSGGDVIYADTVDDKGNIKTGDARAQAIEEAFEIAYQELPPEVADEVVETFVERRSKEDGGEAAALARHFRIKYFFWGTFTRKLVTATVVVGIISIVIYYFKTW